MNERETEREREREREREIGSNKEYIYRLIFHLLRISDNFLFNLKLKNVTNVSPYQLPT
jgi:hypothetical protein